MQTGRAPYACLLLHHTATPEFYTLPLPDALPIFGLRGSDGDGGVAARGHPARGEEAAARAGIGRAGADRSARRVLQSGDDGSAQDRKSTRLNSSHVKISYAVFCLKKKKN